MSETTKPQANSAFGVWRPAFGVLLGTLSSTYLLQKLGSSSSRGSTSKKINDDLRVTELNPPIVDQQSVDDKLY